MDDKICLIAVQYVRALYATTHVRPYENKSPVQAAVQVSIEDCALPEPGHHRVELDVCVTGTNGAGILCYETGARIEAIVVHKNLSQAELTTMVSVHIPGLLLGHVRSSLSTAMLQTGYASTPLPPLTGEQLRKIAQQSHPTTPTGSEGATGHLDD